MSILATARVAAPSTLLATVSRNVGRSVGIGSGTPWLPPGETLGARAFRHGLQPGTGVPWLDEPGPLDARVRLAHGTRVPGSADAVTCLAVRFENGDGTIGDLLLRAPRERRVAPARRAGRETMLTSATPYVVAAGLLALGARQCGAETFELCCLLGDGEWRGFADLRVCPQPRGGARLEVDPLAHRLPGLELWVPAPRVS